MILGHNHVACQGHMAINAILWLWQSLWKNEDRGNDQGLFSSWDFRVFMLTTNNNNKNNNNN